MAQVNFDDLVARLRRLPADKLDRVTNVVDALETEDLQAGMFDRLCGVVPKAEADAILAAIAECERVDAGEW